jgi:hypothetical protein
VLKVLGRGAAGRHGGLDIEEEEENWRRCAMVKTTFANLFKD